jgi:Raf kinase inhibitor-like YbhB/YbcL family protein
MVFELRSPAFVMDGPIPVGYTCNGEDVSPPLEWGDPPEGTQSFVMVMKDISAGNLVHWVLFNLPPDTRSLPEGVPKKGTLSDGSKQGTNNALKVGYFGPCPLPGPNRYRFRLFAIDTMLDLEDGVMVIPVKEAMRGHILGETELIGEFGR